MSILYLFFSRLLFARTVFFSLITRHAIVWCGRYIYCCYYYSSFSAIFIPIRSERLFFYSLQNNFIFGSLVRFYEGVVAIPFTNVAIQLPAISCIEDTSYSCIRKYIKLYVHNKGFGRVVPVHTHKHVVPSTLYRKMRRKFGTANGRISDVVHSRTHTHTQLHNIRGMEGGLVNRQNKIKTMMISNMQKFK